MVKLVGVVVDKVLYTENIDLRKDFTPFNPGMGPSPRRDNEKNLGSLTFPLAIILGKFISHELVASLAEASRLPGCHTRVRLQRVLLYFPRTLDIAHKRR